jgi:hypothetical protein
MTRRLTQPAAGEGQATSPGREFRRDYFQRRVPETKNRSLHEIERDLDLPGRHDDLDHRPVCGTRG